MAVFALVLVLTERIQRVLGERFVVAVGRLMGLILVAVAFEMLLQGVMAFVLQIGQKYRTWSARLKRRHLLLNRPKYALTVFALGLNANAVAELHELGHRLAAFYGFYRTLFCDAAVAVGPVFVADGT